MTEPKLQAALLVAKGRLSNEQVAKRFGIAVRTLSDWKADPEFTAEVNRHLDRWRREIGTKGVADQRRRLFRLNDRWRRLQAVIERRADEMRQAQAEIDERRASIQRLRAEAMAEPDPDTRELLLYRIPQDEADIPASAFTGLMVRRKKSIHLGEKSYETVWEYEFDGAVFAEQRAIEQQAAQETGQWKQRVVLEDPNEAVSIALAKVLSPEQLARVEEEMLRQSGDAAPYVSDDSPDAEPDTDPGSGGTTPDLGG